MPKSVYKSDTPRPQKARSLLAGSTNSVGQQAALDSGRESTNRECKGEPCARL
jgi:hypothetical protein